jgi:hypothetical protein
MNHRLLAVVLAIMLSSVKAAWAQDASAGTSTAAHCIDDAGNPCVPLACDGALCQTTNGASCRAMNGRASMAVLASLALVLGIARRRRRSLAAVLAFVMLVCPGIARG